MPELTVEDIITLSTHVHGITMKARITAVHRRDHHVDIDAVILDDEPSDEG
jgi:hypothetical protein